ncbi:MAG: helix-turn-helix domain containing protein [Blastocatellales bacterium]|nr:helix-turn-helix domain containing protein [Blastocatellales bacterium]
MSPSLAFCAKFTPEIHLTAIMLWHYSLYTVFERELMPKRRKPDPKEIALKREGALNPHPEEISDPLFREHGFFDPRDLVQARYEMLRRQRVDGLSVAAAAEAFGISRPTFYQAQNEFARAGLLGLLPKHRGPKEGHKLSDQVVDYILEKKRSQPDITTAECLRIIKERFGVIAHRRSLERALGRKKNDKS